MIRLHCSREVGPAYAMTRSPKIGISPHVPLRPSLHSRTLRRMRLSTFSAAHPPGWRSTPGTASLTSMTVRPRPHAGLCDSCIHQRLVRNTRGSVFSLCERSRTEKGYPRYPKTPVLACHGHKGREPRPGA